MLQANQNQKPLIATLENVMGFLRGPIEGLLIQELIFVFVIWVLLVFGRKAAKFYKN